jgi:hypothetical protein
MFEPFVQQKLLYKQIFTNFVSFSDFYFKFPQVDNTLNWQYIEMAIPIFVYFEPTQHHL